MNFKKGDPVPQWLAQGDMVFGCNAKVEDYGAGYRVSPISSMGPSDFLMTGKEQPHFPKPITLWTEPTAASERSKEGQ